MRYKVMRLICMFDLPTETPNERKAYRRFRKLLISEGFIMLQYSVYMRTCPSRDYSNRMSSKLDQKAPPNGHIRLVAITEKQYEDMKIIIGTKSHTEQMVGVERMIFL
ncbi:CRISPR-associated endonuclease Cas2 [Petrocella sp. FN5]|uniref:CRISPR-associated endonuclease Cas2 n=1 Tax=Petrocella sp. FN5 TaxID=3032002 RepID=UPI0023DACD62|nr:CRISPR-associated endonuclease Cas2 [Petrocella sp. FN5]MDF1618740.1 CRISPR-associated endonuclease Cas2 [Petrocella sp. FN5]